MPENAAIMVKREEIFIQRLNEQGVRGFVTRDELEQLAWEHIFTINLSVGEANAIHKWVDSLPWSAVGTVNITI